MYSPPTESADSPLAQAWFSGNTDFRREPLLIDLNGRTLKGQAMLTIAVRDIHGSGAPYFDLVSDKLQANGIDPKEALRFVNDTQHEIPEDLRIFRILPEDPPRGRKVRAVWDTIIGAGRRVIERFGPQPKEEHS